MDQEPAMSVVGLDVGLAELLYRGGPGRGHRDHRQRVQRPVHPVSGSLVAGDSRRGLGILGNPGCGWPRNAGGERSAVLGGAPLHGDRCGLPGRWWGGACSRISERGVFWIRGGQRKPENLVSRGGQCRRASSWELVGGPSRRLGPFLARSPASSFRGRPRFPTRLLGAG